MHLKPFDHFSFSVKINVVQLIFNRHKSKFKSELLLSTQQFSFLFLSADNHIVFEQIRHPFICNGFVPDAVNKYTINSFGLFFTFNTITFYFIVYKCSYNSSKFISIIKALQIYIVQSKIFSDWLASRWMPVFNL